MSVLRQLFTRKPIAALMADTDEQHGLKRALGAGDLIMLAIGAVIGAGTGAAIASEGDRRRGGYYWYQDGCYIQRGDGYWMRVDPRYCY